MGSTLVTSSPRGRSDGDRHQRALVTEYALHGSFGAFNDLAAEFSE